MELSIICVNWNSVDYLRECVASIHEFTSDVSYEIIIVDNASPEGGTERLKDQFQNIRLIKSDVNLGFAGANNLGFKHAAGSYVLFLNPDTKLKTPAISLMLRYIHSLPDAGIIGCRLLNTDLSVQLSSIRKFPTILNQMLDFEYCQLRWPKCHLWKIDALFSCSAKACEVDVISGACMLMHREVFERVGGFNEDYFMYAEDIDLCYKVTHAGLKNYYIGDAVIVHYSGGCSSRQSGSQWKTVMNYRAMFKYFGKTHGRVHQYLYRAAMVAAGAARLAPLLLGQALGNIIWDKKSYQMASEKWKTVLKCAIGRQRLSIED